MEPRPRLFHLDLTGDGPLVAWEPSAPEGVFLAAMGGGAAALALLLEPGDGPRLALSVGEAVRRGLPTAGRLGLAARVPLSGLHAEGQVGGTAGARLASFADALRLEGRAREPGTVLVLGPRGALARYLRPELLPLPPRERLRRLAAEFETDAVLAPGPAAHAGSPLANLAAGGNEASFVGRGGLGTVFADLGLVALVFTAPALEPLPEPGARRLQEELLASPRLRARAEGGSLELFGDLAARGELDPSTARRLEAEGRERGIGRKGCRGCPTPCGWIFETSEGERQAGRFGALRAVGTALGLGTLDGALGLVARADRLGIDAKEAGAALALLFEERAAGRLPGPVGTGDPEAVGAELDALATDPTHPAFGGLGRLAASLGRLDVPLARGQSVRPEAGSAALLGQCVATAGSDPMRTFPFLTEAGGRRRLEELFGAGWLPEGAEDPTNPAGKGRLVYWHENLVAALDVVGFCAFSAAGLLADGVLSLDELARWILPTVLSRPSDAAWSARAPGTRLLALGAHVVALRRELNRRYGEAPGADRPAFAAAWLDEPGRLDEYLELRGLDGQGVPRAGALWAFGTPALLSMAPDSLAPAASPTPARGARLGADEPARHGEVHVRCGGRLAELLGPERRVAVLFPENLRGLLAELARTEPRAAGLLLRAGDPVPAVWCRGRRLAPGDALAPGAVLDLVTALAGG